jgi:hypothetical protein
MALKYKLDSKPEQYEDLYVEREGKFYLDVEGARDEAELNKVNQALAKERNFAKEIKSKLSAFESLVGDGRTLDDLRADLERIPELEAGQKGKLSKEELENLANERAKSKLIPLERQSKELASKLEEATKQLQEYQAKEIRRTIHDQVRSIAAETKAHEHAYASSDGALMLLADKIFEVNEAGQVVVKAGTGYPEGLSAKDVLPDIQRKHGYLWPASQGGGAGGGTAGYTGENPFKNGSLDERVALYKKDPKRAEQLMKAAGLKTVYDGL